MKKIILGIVFFAILGFITGCAIIPSPGYNYEVSTKSETPNAEITILETRWNKGNKGMPGLGGPGILGFNTSFKNITDDVISIVWEKSTVSYDGKSHIPFIEGQRFINASTPQSPTVIPPNGSTTLFIASAGQANYVDGYGWRIFPIYTNTVTLVFCIEQNNKSSFYTINVNSIEPLQ
ncbi:MAG: hypothetical protein LBU88_08775 [Treponema sp.]|nr:hypothetical protein [Treponema sp.]